MPGLGMVSAAVLILASGWLANLTLPSRKAVRVRNAFLLRRGRPADFAWTPSTRPADFRVEHKPAPDVIEEAVRDAGLKAVKEDWPRALVLVTMLLRHWKHEGAIQADLASTYAGIVAGGGYCADYVRVYLAAAGSAGLFCRQWAFSFDGFGGHGHTVVEVYDRQRAKWCFLDVHNNVYAVKKGTDGPLDALGLRNALVDSPSSVEFRRAGPGRLGFEHFTKLLAYYCRGAPQWYLCWGNDVVTRERIGLPGALLNVSGRLSHAVASAIGLPPMVAVATAENEPQILDMEALRRKVIGALALVAVLGFVVAMQLNGQALSIRHA